MRPLLNLLPVAQKHGLQFVGEGDRSADGMGVEEAEIAGTGEAISTTAEDAAGPAAPEDDNEDNGEEEEATVTTITRVRLCSSIGGEEEDDSVPRERGASLSSEEECVNGPLSGFEVGDTVITQGVGDVDKIFGGDNEVE